MATEIKIEKNRFNELVHKWVNNIHPNNKDFKHKVFWTMWEKYDGSITICYRLDFSGKPKYIYNITKEEALNKYL